MVTAEVEAVLAKRPDLTVVKVADGAKDNWTFLTRALPAGVEFIDFYAVAHLKDAFDTAHGTDSPKAAAQFKKYRHLLRHEPDGANRVIRAWCICARSLRATSESHRCSATSVAIATA